MIQLKNVTYITCGGGDLFQKGESFPPKFTVYTPGLPTDMRWNTLNQNHHCLFSSQPLVACTNKHT